MYSMIKRLYSVAVKRVGGRGGPANTAYPTRQQKRRFGPAAPPARLPVPAPHGRTASPAQLHRQSGCRRSASLAAGAEVARGRFGRVGWLGGKTVGMSEPERGVGFDPGAELGPRLRRVREDRGLSVRELARRISCSPSLISQIERGLSAPSVGILYAIASELRASLDFLFGVTVPGDAMLATAHGDGQVRPEGGGNGTGASGHGLVQRRSSRRTIDLASGVRWERLTPGADERVDFLEVIYEPSGHSTDARRPLRHDGQEYGL